VTPEATVQVKPALYRAKDAATYLGVSVLTIEHLVANGQLERRYIGIRHYRITGTSLDAYVASLPAEAPTDD